MDAYCPRCEEGIPQVDHTVLRQGKCPTCGGQISVGGVTADLPLDGAIAMTFTAGSRVALPLDATFEESQIDLEVAALVGGGGLRVQCALPRGAYVTVLLELLVGSVVDAARRTRSAFEEDGAGVSSNGSD